MCTMHQDTSDSSRQHKRPQFCSQDPAALKLWEIEPFFRCPVIGLCLTPREQKQVLKKSGQASKNQCPYDVHETLVAAAASENRVSQKVERLLKCKFGVQVERLHRLAVQDFMNRWKDAWKAGQYLAEFWAAVSRRDLPVAFRKEIFGTIHMAMHGNVELAVYTARRQDRLKGKIEEQSSKIKELNLGRQALRKENEALERMLADVNDALGGMLSAVKSSLNPAGRKCCLPSGPEEIRMPGRRLELERENQRQAATIADQAALLEAKDRKLALLGKRVARLSRELERQQQAEALFKIEAQETLGAFFEMNRCGSDCPAFDLCRKRVLIVGGISRMEALYRRLVESCGGVLEYHDGNVKGGARRLQSRLKRCDFVLCPVNCNSHAACSLVKNLGKKLNKPVHMLANFSLNTVSQAIRDCAAGQAANN